MEYRYMLEVGIVYGTKKYDFMTSVLKLFPSALAPQVMAKTQKIFLVLKTESIKLSHCMVNRAVGSLHKSTVSNL